MENLGLPRHECRRNVACSPGYRLLSEHRHRFVGASPRSSVYRRSRPGAMGSHQVGAEGQIRLLAQERTHDLDLAVAAGDVECVGGLVSCHGWRTWQTRSVWRKAATTSSRGARQEHGGAVEGGLHMINRTDLGGAA